MKTIDYKTYPILQDIENGTLDNLRCLHPNDKQGYDLCTVLLKGIWGVAASKIRENVCYPCKTYLQAVSQSTHCFDNLILQEVYNGEVPEGADHWVDTMELKPLTDEEKKREEAVARILGDAHGCYFVGGSAIVYGMKLSEGVEKGYQFAIEVCDGFLVSAFIQNGEDYAYMCSNSPSVIKRNIDAFGLDLARNAQWLVSNLSHTANMLVMFEKYAKVETRYVASGTKARLEMSNMYPTINNTRLKVNIRDSRYFTTAIRDKEFMARGHLRLQAKKVNGEWTRELIYIDSFKKKGYHRTATLDKKKVC